MAKFNDSDVLRRNYISNILEANNLYNNNLGRRCDLNKVHPSSYARLTVKVKMIINS